VTITLYMYMFIYYNGGRGPVGPVGGVYGDNYIIYVYIYILRGGRGRAGAGRRGKMVYFLLLFELCVICELSKMWL